MHIKRTQTSQKEVSIPLSKVQPGDTVRFASTTFEEAMESGAFYLKVNAPHLKERCMLTCFKDGTPLERDGDHQMIVHVSEVSVKE